ncbi:M20/M25/M40 family metallo-hydrolase [Phycicoccus sp. CSK15P-2]|uniref:M20/M25/M40 family metallo-hydrolase n=1 Tax=Phycicoccus sp. CSK15P-2 TaxID=2807627 RepID=UPI00194FE8D2|nr:M20/M25/M40 family metallo-hydrolase [Phycicoccus sp. CSK15P-2]MBM6404542.1 M20/M25/M40 family metallo-hydrolase [Phycicoccus sp. CSK15P-2]
MDLGALISDTRELVACESPSSDLAAVARSAEVTAQVGARRLGSEPERVVVGGRTHLRWRLGSAPGSVLVLGHHDTVWPLGTLERYPCVVEDGILRGPGCLDMKAGLAMAFHALAGLDGVTLLVTGDEELGSPSSRPLVEEEARAAGAALVLEAADDSGALKGERKGVSLYEVRVRGRASHAGLAPEQGVNASVELAHQVLALAALARPDLGTTVTPTLMRGGTTTNTVPADASVAVDVRVRTVAEQSRVDHAVNALRAVLPEVLLEPTGGPNRPPMEARSSAALLDRAAAVAERSGLPVPFGTAVGGASDGNLTAGVGTPTLDGLGAVGGGAHAADEHVRVDELAPRTRLLAELVRDLLSDPSATMEPEEGR